METKTPVNLGDRIHLIDGFDLGFPGRTGTYVLKEEALTLVETGPSPSIPYVLEGLRQLSIDPKDVEYIILTHIHLDHAGGAGVLAKECPNATFIVHERGKRHLADPSRLIAGAQAVYGEKFDQLFDPILPIPKEKLLTKADGDTLTLGPDCTLTFYDTPGHAKHHLGIYDPISRGIFTGDTAGVRYHQTEDYKFTFYLPTTSPNQFDPGAMQQSIQRFRELNPKRVYFGHFGESSEPTKVFDQVSEWIPEFVKVSEQAMANREGTEGIQGRLHEMVSSYLANHDIPDNHRVYEILELDLAVCAMGLADYIKKKQ